MKIFYIRSSQRRPLHPSEQVQSKALVQVPPLRQGGIQIAACEGRVIAVILTAQYCDCNISQTILTYAAVASTPTGYTITDIRSSTTTIDTTIRANSYDGYNTVWVLLSDNFQACMHVYSMQQL